MSICNAGVENYFCKAFVKCDTAIKRPSLLPISMKQMYFFQNKNQEE